MKMFTRQILPVALLLVCFVATEFKTFAGGVVTGVSITAAAVWWLWFYGCGHYLDRD